MKHDKLLLFFCLLYAFSINAQTTPQDTTAHAIVEQMPQFPGGEQAMMLFIHDSISYPKALANAGIGGTVYVNFIVEKDGSITEVNVLRGIENAPQLNAEAIRVVRSMPKWIPGKQNGMVVRVMYNLPIKYLSSKK